MPTYFKCKGFGQVEPASYKRVEPGEHRVEVTRAIVYSTKFEVHFKVLDEGEGHGTPLRENFLDGYSQAEARLRDFAAAINEPITEDGINTEACVGKTLYVTVVHEGKWENVISHRPDF